MRKDIQGIGLGLASRFAGSKFAQKYGLAKSAERIVYLTTREGFKLAGKFAQKSANTPSAAVALPSDARPKSLFDLSLSEEQEMIRAAVETYAREVIRGLGHDADAHSALPDDFLENSMALGLNLFTVPENQGGAAQSYSPTTSAIIAEQLAHGDFTLAFSALAPVAVANALVKWGTAQQQQQWLPLWLNDKPVRAAIAVQEPHPLFDAEQLTCTATRCKTGFELNGVKSLVPLGSNADLYLIAARYQDHNQLFTVPGHSAGINIHAAPAMGLRAASTGTLTLKNVRVDSNALLGGNGKDTKFNYTEFIDLGQLHWCALALGTCQAALDYCITYANDRIAFGEPISHRQSVAFMISNMAIEIESMRLLTWRAAALAEQGQPFHREAYLAHLLCSEKAMEIGTNAVQIVGGHGFTKEHPVERWYRDLRILGCISSGLHL